MSDKPFTREDLARADVKLLRDGRAANAVVTCVTWKGRRWTVKDFSSRSWWVRRLLAPFLLGRELKILRRLSGVDGVAEEAFRIDADAIAVSFVEGRNLSRVTREEVTIEFLEAFEKLLDEMHARNVVHLDLRGTGNIVMRPDGTSRSGASSIPRRWARSASASSSASTACAATGFSAGTSAKRRSTAAPAPDFQQQPSRSPRRGSFYRLWLSTYSR